MTARRVGEDGATDAVERVSNDRLTFLMQHGAGKPSDVPPLCLDLRDCRARLAAAERERDEARQELSVSIERDKMWQAAEAQVAALREALAVTWPGISGRVALGGDVQRGHAMATAVLTDTAAAAQAHDQRVRAEAREEAMREQLAVGHQFLDLERDRVRREERERCAKVADELSEVESHVSGVHSGNAGSLVHEAAAMAGRLTRKSIAAAIRALGEEIPDGYRVEDPVEDA